MVVLPPGWCWLARLAAGWQTRGLACSSTATLAGVGTCGIDGTAAAADADATAAASMRSRSCVRFDDILADFGLGEKESYAKS
jgi:hypothetical protein